MVRASADGNVIGTHGFYVDVTPSASDPLTEELVDAAVAEIAANRATIEGQGHADADLPGRRRRRLRAAQVALPGDQPQTAYPGQLLAEFAGLSYDETLPPRATFDHLLLTAQQRIPTGNS
jgi:hypothetical protein